MPLHFRQLKDDPDDAKVPVDHGALAKVLIDHGALAKVPVDHGALAKVPPAGPSKATEDQKGGRREKIIARAAAGDR